jgi:hypothetical protein
MTVRCKEDERHARDEPQASLVLAVCAPLAQEEPHASLVLAVCAPVKQEEQEGAAQSDVYKNVAVHKWRRRRLWWWRWWWWGGGGLRTQQEKRVEQGRTE